MDNTFSPRQRRDYLERIGILRQPANELEDLKSLHRHHLLHIPFENLDIQRGQPLSLQRDDLFRKVIRDRRGGFCYELNYLFYLLLKSLRFDVKMISARVYNDAGAEGPAHDHLALIVTLGEQWLADVGFGKLSVYPIRMGSDTITQQGKERFHVKKVETNQYLLSTYDAEDVPKKNYLFDTNQVPIETFYDQCRLKQESPESHFVKNLICTQVTDQGRITVRNDRFIETLQGERMEKLITSRGELQHILQSRFGMEIDTSEIEI